MRRREGEVGELASYLSEFQTLLTLAEWVADTLLPTLGSVRLTPAKEVPDLRIEEVGTEEGKKGGEREKEV